MEQDANVLITMAADGDFLVTRQGKALGVVRRGGDAFTCWPCDAEFPHLGPFAHLSDAVAACIEHADRMLLV